jgi:hypothetical protein
MKGGAVDSFGAGMSRHGAIFHIFNGNGRLGLWAPAVHGAEQEREHPAFPW